MYSFRLATEEDFDTVYEFAKAFFFETPFANTYEFSETRIKEVIRIYLGAPKTEAVVVLLTKDEVPVGLIAGIASRPIFSDGVHTTEQIWWVDPSHRKSKHAIGLLHAFEQWSKKIGASHCIMASLKEVTDLTKLYEKLGYKEYEQAFLKEIRS